MPTPNWMPTHRYLNKIGLSHCRFQPEPFRQRSLSLMKTNLKYTKFLKELCVHKRKKMKGGVELGGIVSTLTQHDEFTAGAQQALPKKCRDPEIFFVPCTIGDCTFADAMLDLGASINVMPTSIYKHEDLEYSNNAGVQVAEIEKQLSMQVTTMFITEYMLATSNQEGKKVEANSIKRTNSEDRNLVLSGSDSNTKHNVEFDSNPIRTGYTPTNMSKLCSKWDGPFVITHVFPCGVVELKDENTNNTFQVNGHQIKLFHEGPASTMAKMESISLMESAPPDDLP
ncbi:hypothetical protein CR513_29888, partial [Mucuna pruriens]